MISLKKLIEAGQSFQEYLGAMGTVIENLTEAEYALVDLHKNKSVYEKHLKEGSKFIQPTHLRYPLSYRHHNKLVGWI